MWTKTTLGESCKMYQPKTISAKEMVSDGEYVVFGANGIIGRYDKYNHSEPQLLVTCRGATCGYVNVSEPKSWITGNSMVIQPDTSKISMRFMEYVCRGGIDLSKAITGAAQPQITRKSLEPIEFSYPPLAEQERIVATLDAAFAKIDAAIKISQDRKAKLDIFKASVINNAFQKLDNEIHMGEIFKFVRGPFGGSLKKNIFLEKGFAVYEQKHAIKNQCNDFRYFISQDKFNEMSRFKVTPNSILMSCSGTIGKTTIVPENPTAGIINQALLMIQPSESVLPNFTKLFMESTRFSEQLMDTVGGAAQKNVASVKVLKEISMPIPHIEDQQEIVSRITQIIRSIETLNKTNEDTIKKYLKLKSAILKQELQSSEAA